MTDLFTTPRPDFNRDRWSRPLIAPPGGGKPVSYTRATTFVGAAEDMWNINRWERRMVALGLADRKDLLLAVAAHRDDKKRLDRICDDAKEAAKASASATTGTAVHALTEVVDQGRDLPALPDDVLASLEAYRAQMARFQIHDIEAHLVQDYLKVAGTTDRILEYHGEVYIGDVKGLALTTPLPTPAGWTTMGAVEVGDEVIGSDGHPCRVTVKSETKRIGTYVVSFDDSSQIVCDTEHIWWTIAGQRGDADPEPRSIAEVVDTLRGDYGQAQHRVPVTEPLDLPEAELPIDPYVLGCWLGDGNKGCGEITKGADLFDVLESDGVDLGKIQVDSRNGIITRTVLGLKPRLRALGVLGNKHIPDVYLRGSIDQRRRFLAGLMDTDGTWNTARNRATFTTTTKAFAVAVEELLCTLGQRPHVAEVERSGFGLTVTAYDVEWTPVDMMPFRLPRKVTKVAEGLAQGKSLAKARRRVIVSVEPGPDVDTACIGVDSANHTYLCGERMIPTHNTGSTVELGVQKIAGQLAMYARSRPYDVVTDTRGDAHGASVHRGLIIWLPATQPGHCELIWVDLLAGWEWVKTCRDLRAKRGWKYADLTEPFDPNVKPTLSMRQNGVGPASLDDLVRNATTVDDLYALYEEHAAEWTDALTQTASARKAELEGHVA